MTAQPNITARRAVNALNALRRPPVEDRTADNTPDYAAYAYDFAAGMRSLARLTRRQQELEARLQEATQAFLIEQHADDLAELEHVRSSRSAQEAELRGHALKAWEITGRRTHVKGCGVRISNRLRIADPARALAWCEANHPAAVRRAIDERLFRGDVEAGLVDESVACMAEEAVSTLATPDTLLRDWLAE